MSSIFSDTVFTNVAETHEGGVWWEGMGSPPSSLIDWKGRAWEPGMGNAAHPNSRSVEYGEKSTLHDAPHGTQIPQTTTYWKNQIYF